MGTRSAPRAKSLAHRARRLQRQRARQKVGEKNEFGVESATLATSTLNAPHPLADSPTVVAENWAESIEELTPIKQVAAAALILGQNVSKTASALGVDRRTIQRWRKLDPDFQLAMVETRQEVIVSSRQRMLLLSETAVGIVEAQLNNDQNARAALALLRNVGVISPAALDARQYEPVEPPAETSTAETSTADEFRAQSATSPAADLPAPATAEEEVYEFSDLSPAQQVAVQAFYVGKPLPEVAALAQSSEACVRGWLCQDRRFFTVLSALQFERIQHVKHRILALIDRAILLVQNALAANDGRLALSLLRGMGMMR